jgi:hypothetical protein
MALFRDRSIEDVVSKLDLALPGPSTVARSSISQARDRLGSEPMKWLFDPTQYPADEIIALYHERWELELGYDELKTELLGREEAIRSRTPKRVEQELWGVLLAYNLVRSEMERIAKSAKVEPTRISFIESLRIMRDEWMWLSVTSPGAIPKRLAAMRASIKRYVLPPAARNEATRAP